MVYPRSIIVYPSGACGDLLKTLCVNQLTNESLILSDVGKVNCAKPLWDYIQQRRKIDPSQCHAIENTHFINAAMLEQFPHAKIYQIAIPLERCRRIIQGFFTKLGITESSQIADWRANHPIWWRWNSDLLGRDVACYDDLLTSQMLSSYQEMIEFSEIMGNRAAYKIEFLKILDAQHCSRIAANLLGTALPNTELFFQQYQSWYEKNLWFVDLVNG